MRKVPNYIQYWLDSFLLIDLVFVLSLLYNCLIDGISCMENGSFGTALFFLPWTLLLNFYPSQINSNWEPFLMGLFGLFAHICLAFLLAKLFKKKKVGRLFTLIVALLVVFGGAILTFGFLVKLGYII